MKGQAVPSVCLSVDNTSQSLALTWFRPGPALLLGATQLVPWAWGGLLSTTSCSALESIISHLAKFAVRCFGTTLPD